MENGEGTLMWLLLFLHNRLLFLNDKDDTVIVGDYDDVATVNGFCDVRSANLPVVAIDANATEFVGADFFDDGGFPAKQGIHTGASIAA